MDTILTVLSVVAGLSGWAAIGAWWLRERTKSVHAMKGLRRRNDRLQRAVIFTLAKWREHVEQTRSFLAIEEEYAERLAQEAGVSARDVRTTVRAIVETRQGSHVSNIPNSSSALGLQIEKIQDVHRYVESDEGTLADLQINDELRKAA
jgi:hypothetical protein